MTPPVRRALVVGAVVLALVAIGAAATGWYLLGEERRMGRMVGSLLSSRTGLPITVDRATTDGFRLTLRGVRVAAGVDMRVSRLEITGGVLPLVAPAGREVTVVATSASVTLPPGAGGGAPDAGTLDGVRARALQLLAWPGVLSLRMLGGELRSSGQVFAFDLTVDKTAAGAVAVTLALSPDGAPSALRLDARATAGAAGALALALDLAAQPARLGALWPPAVPAPSSLAARGDLALATGGDVSTTSRLTAAMEKAPPAVLDLAARYDARAGTVAVSRYTLTREDGIRLEGAARSETVNGALRLVADARGTVEASRLDTRVTYALADGAFAGQADVAPLTAQAVWRRLGLGAPPTQASARAVSAKFSGANGARGLSAAVDATFTGLETARAPRFPVDGSLTAAARFTRDERGLALAGVERSTLTLRRERATVAVLTARSKTGSAAWPMAVEASVADLSRVAPLLPVPAALAGTAHATGDVAYTRGASFAGTVDAHLTRASLTVGAPVVATNVWAALPVRWGEGSGDKIGTVSAERVTAYGILLERLTGSGRIVDGRLLLPDLRYIHYGGRGSGWLDALVTAAGVDFSTRLEGEEVDLAAAASASGVTGGRVSGRVRYVMAAQYAPARGLSALGRVASEEGGGEVSIDAIERLLESPAVQVESTGLLRRTLQNLKTFEYASLEGDVRVGGGTGYVDLSLKGKKRLGVFPGPVDAINFRNVPLAVLGRTLDRGSTP